MVEGGNMSRREVVKGMTASSILGVLPGIGKAEEQPSISESDRYIIGTDSSDAVTAAGVNAGSVDQILDFGSIGKAVVGQFQKPDVEALNQRSDVRYIERDRRHEGGKESFPWGIDRIDADRTTAAGYTGSGAHIAVLDSGIDENHPDLQPNLGRGKSFVDYTTSWNDDNGHGTHCAGIAAAAENTQGVIGTAPAPTLHAGKVLNQNGFGYYSWAAAGIKWAADQNYDVVSMSFGSTEFSQTELDACRYAYNRGVLLVAMGGNENGGTVTTPGRYPMVIAVSATTQSDALSSFSSTGNDIELAAPGSRIYSTVPSGYGYDSGTSMACPHVSGVGGLLMSRAGGNLSNTETRQRLRKTAEDIGLSEDKQGNGLVDAEAAVTKPLSGGPTHTLRFEGSGGFSFYAFRATGDVDPDGNLTSEDTINGPTAFGAVGGGTDSYIFKGDLQHLYVDGGVTVFLDGQQINPDDYESVISIQGDGSYTSYEFGVSGEITGTQGTTGEDTVNPASASGAIAGGSDSYTFTGTISGLSKSGSAAVILNGQEVDPSLFSPFSGGTNSLRIEGSGEFTYYAFQASGDVSSGGNLTSEDNIDGTTAAGAVGGGADTYTFEGELQNLYVGDGATVFVNDQEISLSDYESVVSIQSDGSYTTYDFTVSGEITGTQGTTGEDTVNPASASGAIAGGSDSYTFTGTFGSFARNGDAAIVLNGQEVDPALL